MHGAWDLRNAGTSARNVTGKLGTSCCGILWQFLICCHQSDDDLLLIVRVSAYETLRLFSVLVPEWLAGDMERQAARYSILSYGPHLSCLERFGRMQGRKLITCCMSNFGSWMMHDVVPCPWLTKLTDSRVSLRAAHGHKPQPIISFFSLIDDQDDQKR